MKRAVCPLSFYVFQREPHRASSRCPCVRAQFDACEVQRAEHNNEHPQIFEEEPLTLGAELPLTGVFPCAEEVLDVATPQPQTHECNRQLEKIVVAINS